MSATCNKKPLAPQADNGEGRKKKKTKYSKFSLAKNHEGDTEPTLDLLRAQREQVLRGPFLKEHARDLPITKVEANPSAEYPDGPMYKRFARAHDELTNSLGGLRINLGFHGTREHNVKNILEEGLKEEYRHGQVYGGGEYFQDYSNGSMYYCHGGTKMIVFAYLTDASGRALNSTEERLREAKRKGINVCSRVDFQCPLFTLEFPTAQFHADLVNNVAMPPIGYTSWEKWALATTMEAPPPQSMERKRIQLQIDRVGEEQRVQFFRQQNGVKVGGAWPDKQYYVLQADMMEEALKLFYLEGAEDFGSDWDEDAFHDLYRSIKPLPSKMDEDSFLAALRRLIRMENVRRIQDILLHKLMREPVVHFKRKPFPEKVPEPAPPPPPPPPPTTHQVENQARGASYKAGVAKRQAEAEKARYETSPAGVAAAAAAPANATAAPAATEAKVEAMKKQMQEMKRHMQMQQQGLRGPASLGKGPSKAKAARPRLPRPTRQS